ncbi:ankyrin homolog isoform X1 [Procambarus clarkii]|uniref:ankyrin homolog isoform X1 n=1 Tax=Procambarus clarkii TaxID=6728 RepID=UPI00374467DD
MVRGMLMVWVAVCLTHLAPVVNSALTGKSIKRLLLKNDTKRALDALVDDSGNELIIWTDTNNVTLLHYAALVGAGAVAEYLLDNGLSVDSTETSRGETPLHWCARHSNLRVMQILVERGANLYAARTPDGYTPHLVATAANFVNGVKYLREKGVDLEYATPSGELALTAAARLNKDKVLSALVNLGAHLDVHDGTGMTPLMYTIRNKNVEAMENLLKSGSDVNLQDNDGTSALMLAGSSGSATILTKLLEYPQDLDVLDNAGDTAMLRWTRSDMTPAVLQLLQYCPDLTLQDPQGKTAQDIAQDRGNSELISAIQTKLDGSCSYGQDSYPLGATRFESCSEWKCNSKCNWENTGNEDPACAVTVVPEGGDGGDTDLDYGGDYSTDNDNGDYGSGMSCASGYQLKCCRCCQCEAITSTTHVAPAALKRALSNVSAGAGVSGDRRFYIAP